MSITLGQGIRVGNGITLGTITHGITLAPTNFVTHYGYGSYVNPNANSGFETTSGAASVGPGYAFYSANLALNSGASADNLAQIRAYWADNGLTTNSRAYMFNVTWGLGSTQASGVAILEFYYNNDNNTWINIGAVDTSNPAWETSFTNYYSGPPYSLVGTWNFPATFDVITPLIENNSNWC